jgi:hypothetical protein
MGWWLMRGAFYENITKYAIPGLSFEVKGTMS